MGSGQLEFDDGGAGAIGSAITQQLRAGEPAGGAEQPCEMLHAHVALGRTSEFGDLLAQPIGAAASERFQQCAVGGISLAHQMETEEEKAWIFSSFDPEDLIRAAQGVSEGRVKFVRGDEEVLPGITAILAKDSHTFGTQWFLVQTRNGPFVVAGDAVYWYSNVERMWPPGYNQGNAFQQIHTYVRMRNVLKKQTSRIIPGHDPSVWERHKTWSTESGNQVAEVNLREDDSSRQPHRVRSGAVPV